MDTSTAEWIRCLACGDKTWNIINAADSQIVSLTASVAKRQNP